jgi:hypothetical protein
MEQKGSPSGMAEQNPARLPCGWISDELVAASVKAHRASLYQKFNGDSRAAVPAQKGLLGKHYELFAAHLADPPQQHAHTHKENTQTDGAGPPEYNE